MDLKAKLAFYKSKAPGAHFEDKIIDWWTGKLGFSHVEIVVEENGQSYMYSSSGRDGGVRRKPHTFDHKTWEYVDVKINKETFYDFFRFTEHCKYDFAGIIGFVLPFQDRENKWFCSEWCSTVLKISGHKALYTKEPSKLSPNKFYQIVTTSPYSS